MITLQLWGKFEPDLPLGLRPVSIVMSRALSSFGRSLFASFSHFSEYRWHHQAHKPPLLHSSVPKNCLILQLRGFIKQPSAMFQPRPNQGALSKSERNMLHVRCRQGGMGLMNEPSCQKQKSDPIRIIVTQFESVDSVEKILPDVVFAAELSRHAFFFQIPIKVIPNLADQIEDPQGVGQVGFCVIALFVQCLEITLPSRHDDSNHQCETGTVKLRPARKLVVRLHPRDLMLKIRNRSREVIPSQCSKNQIPDNGSVLHMPFPQPVDHCPSPRFLQRVAQQREGLVSDTALSELQHRVASLMISMQEQINV